MHEAGQATDRRRDADEGEQLSLVRARVRASRPKPVDPPAAELPVAVVALDVPLAHLDRPFHYLVPEGMSLSAVPGTRVRARFAGREVDGFVLERRASSDHAGRLELLRRVVSAEPVLAPEVAALARAVADRYAGSLADVLRLAVPPRHARVEGEEPPAALVEEHAVAATGRDRLARYPHGARLFDAIEAGGSPRVVWSVLPGPFWAAEVAALVAATVRSGRGALVLAPDARDVAALDVAVTAAIGHGRSVVLTADLGPAERYRRFLAVSRGRVRVVVGTRAAAFAPVADLGLVVVWDDGDPSHAEQRAPYPHAREVAALRAGATGGQSQPALVLAGHAVSAEGALLVASGWARALRPDRAVLRSIAPRVVVPASEPAGDDPLAVAARIPTSAWRAARDALERGPVLVHVPHRGYVTRLACRRCRTLAACAACSGPLVLPGPAPGGATASGPGEAATLRCGWCARLAPDWRCPACEARGLRALRVGAERTAEELGRAFPRTRVVQSTGERPRARVSDRPALVVATPGSEPVADSGYAAALLLDADLALLRPALRAHEDALRRWLSAAALVRGPDEGGVVVVAGDPAARPVQHLLRWDPWAAADSELREREPLALPPTARVATLTGPLLVVQDAADELTRLLRESLAGHGDPADVTLGSPLQLEDVHPGGVHSRVDGRIGSRVDRRVDSRVGRRVGSRVDAGSLAADRDVPDTGPPARVLVRARRRAGPVLSASLAALQAGRAARRAAGPLRVQVDPLDLA